MEENIIYKLLSKELFEGIKHHAEIEIVDSDIKDSSIFIDGYKHSMVGIIALTIAAKKRVIIDNPPLVSDTFVFVAIINELGGNAHIANNKLYIDASEILSTDIPIFLSRCIHGSLYMCPALLVANKRFCFYGSGGCQIGDSLDKNRRPIAHIMSVMGEFGGEINIDESAVSGSLSSVNNIEEIDITRYSTSSNISEGPLVGGATKTAIIMSLLGHNKLIIKNAYLKTDVLDMLRFLRKLALMIK
jgi:UDP-N-acetylglucosamine enolpyruvyl transferase